MEPNTQTDKTNTSIEEELIWIENSKNNPKFFAPLYDKYYEPIFRFISQRIETIETTEDITSQVFLKAIQKIHQYQFKGFPFSSWLYKIALNEITDYYRIQKKERIICINNDNLKELSHIQEDINNEILFDILAKALNHLNEKEMLFIEMRFFEGRAFKEISEILDLTETNTKAKTYRILNKLQSKIQNYINHE